MLPLPASSEELNNKTFKIKNIATKGINKNN
jgi:hypothetical protein